MRVVCRCFRFMETLPEAEMSRYEADRAEAEIAFYVKHRIPPFEDWASDYDESD